MTSQRLNDAMYGAGITAGGIANTKTTFADIMAIDAQSVADSIRNSNDPTLSAAVRQIYAAGARQIAAMAGAEQAAYNNHTLSFQKESYQRHWPLTQLAFANKHWCDSLRVGHDSRRLRCRKQ
jgi:hypothetical protein